MRAAAEWVWWGVLFLVLLAAPLPLGAVNTWWSMPLAAAVAAVGLVGVVGAGVRSRQWPRFPRILAPLGLFLVLVAFELVPLPPGLVALFSPGRASVPAVPGAGHWISLSNYPGATLETLLLHGAVFYLVWALATKRPGVALAVLGIVASIHAAGGLALARLGGTTHKKVLWVFPLPEVLTPFGTYVNKNHFAGLMLLGAGACTAGVLSAYRRWRAHSFVKKGRRIGATLSIGAAGAGLLVTVLAVFASGSRGAALALAIASVAVVLAAGIACGRMRVWPVLLLLVLLFGAAVAARSTVPQSVLDRLFAGDRILDRPRLWHGSLEMTERFPVSGVGLGAFRYVFPRFQSFDPARQFTHAEGDWVQYLAETGVTGSACLLAFLVLVAVVLWRAARIAGPKRDLAIGAALSFTAIVLHGFVDSSLHIPANLVAFSVLLGAIVAIGNSDLGETWSMNPSRYGDHQ